MFSIIIPTFNNLAYLKLCIESIKNFVNQEELLQYMKMSKFQKCNYRNFSNGIVSIHSGWKV